MTNGTMRSGLLGLVLAISIVANTGCGDDASPAQPEPDGSVTSSALDAGPSRIDERSMCVGHVRTNAPRYATDECSSCLCQACGHETISACGSACFDLITCSHDMCADPDDFACVETRCGELLAAASTAAAVQSCGFRACAACAGDASAGDAGT